MDWLVYLLLGAIEQFRKATISLWCLSVCLSVRPHGTIRFRLDGFSWRLVFWVLLKICRVNSSFIQIWQEWLLLVKTNIHFWSYLVQFFLEREKFRTGVVEEIKIRILCSVSFFFLSKIVSFMRMLKNTVGRGRAQMTIWSMRIAFWTPKATHTHTLRMCNT